MYQQTLKLIENNNNKVMLRGIKKDLNSLLFALKEENKYSICELGTEYRNLFSAEERKEWVAVLRSLILKTEIQIERVLKEEL